MGIMIYRDKQAAAAATATLLAAQIIEKPNTVLGLNAHQSSLHIYRQLGAMTAAGMLDWSEVTIFHASELVNRRPGQPGVLNGYLQHHLYDSLAVDTTRIHAPRHNAPSLEAACAAYEADIVEAGGMDVLLLQLGANGHLAYNVPGRAVNALTHVVQLPNDTTMECANMFSFEPEGQIQMITAGMSTLLSAKHIILCAFGKDLAETVSSMLSTAISAEVPASMLQLHPAVTYMLDEDAAIHL